MSSVRLEGVLDPTACWDGDVLYLDPGVLPDDSVLGGLRGAGAWVVPEDTRGWRFLRDPLGINKLFWVRDADGAIVVASRPRRLVDIGCPFSEIHSFPCGAVADPEGFPPRMERSIIPASWFAPSESPVDVEVVASRIRASLLGYLGALASTLRPERVYVCLSGGLDSSGIAALSREIFDDVVAVSFDLKNAGVAPSDDRLAGARVAMDLGLPLLEASASEDELLDGLDFALVEGIDWRDFNVHAALVNTTLANAIEAERMRGALVLTGDLANEFLVDYEAESYGGDDYYRLPRLPPAALRTSLVRGLDSCNREVGIFAACGLRLVQPYAVAVDDYLSLPEEFLRKGERKQSLGRMIFGSRIPEHVYERRKVRAQVGSAAGGGVLRLCVDKGIDGAWLRRRFCELHDVVDGSVLDRFMRAGRYRTGVPSARREGEDGAR